MKVKKYESLSILWGNVAMSSLQFIYKKNRVSYKILTWSKLHAIKELNMKLFLFDQRPLDLVMHKLIYISTQ